jgi:hypothetical protein
MQHMRLVTVVRIFKGGVIGESAISSEVSETYSEKKLAARVWKQYEMAKVEADARLAKKQEIGELQMAMFESA